MEYIIERKTLDIYHYLQGLMKSNRNNMKQYLTINQLVEIFPAFSKNRIYNMINQEGLKHIKGKPIVIDIDDFINFIDNQKEIEENTIEQEYAKKFFNIPKETIKYV